MRPVRVESLAELEEVFGLAITGRESGDISRNGNKILHLLMQPSQRMLG